MPTNRLPHDKKGHELKVGDKVILECEVVESRAGQQDSANVQLKVCHNASVRTVNNPGVPGEIAINSIYCERISGKDETVEEAAKRGYDKVENSENEG